jgi:putative endonuclease
MYFVYLIKSIKFPDQLYVGYTINLEERIEKHNEGGSIHTTKYKPWELIAYFAFKSESTAIEFEKYLKSGSGRAFATKRLRI